MGRPSTLTTGRSRPLVTLRAARSHDVALIRDWRNDPEAVRFSVTGRPVSDSEHARWFSATLANPTKQLWIAEEHGVPVGQVRVDITGDAGVVSIAVAAAARGRGLGQQVLRGALAEIDRQHIVTRLTALTHPDNLASIHAFEEAGFRRRNELEGGFIVLEMRLR